MADTSDYEGRIRTFVLDEFLSGEDPSQLSSTTPLYDTGVLDSIATLKLVSFLEEEYAISFEAHEVDPANFATVHEIARLTASKVDGVSDS